MTDAHANISLKTRVSPIWIVPIVALALGIYMVIVTFQNEGPEIEHGTWAVESVDRSARRPTRGGSWNGPVQHARSARRDGANPLTRYSYVGIRLVRSV